MDDRFWLIGVINGTKSLSRPMRHNDKAHPRPVLDPRRPSGAASVRPFTGIGCNQSSDLSTRLPQLHNIPDGRRNLELE